MRTNQPDRWHAFECFNHSKYSHTGIVFDLRTSGDYPEVPAALCPICGSACELRGSWDADPDGYGSRATSVQDWDNDNPTPGRFVTDYPIVELGDIPRKPAPIREVQILKFDGNKYADIKILKEDIVVNIKLGYVYQIP